MVVGVLVVVACSGDSIQTTMDNVVVKNGNVVGNERTKKYHVAPCYFIPQIQKTVRFNNTRDAILSGYTCDSASNGCWSCGK